FNSMQNVLFKETQRNTYLLVPFALASLVFGYLCVMQIGFDKPMGNHPASNPMLLLLFALSVIAVIFFNYQKLKLIVTPEEMQVSYGLLAGTQIIRISEIKSITIRKYDGLKEFGGWGVRYNASTSCFTVSGDDGIDIDMNDGRKFLIGTHQIIGVKRVLESLAVNKP
ncbi:MAG TPA: hypothetical protein VL490_09630, partial [Mucilaginibacter sp.]|nr:hypothetical protein [Mucilaginibacter sp.]